eukprot:SAG22_NODE_3322_length_1780_cov_0.989887_1_plen_270_part_10
MAWARRMVGLLQRRKPERQLQHELDSYRLASLTSYRMHGQYSRALVLSAVAREPLAQQKPECPGTPFAAPRFSPFRLAGCLARHAGQKLEHRPQDAEAYCGQLCADLGKQVGWLLTSGAANHLPAATAAEARQLVAAADDARLSLRQAAGFCLHVDQSAVGPGAGAGASAATALCVGWRWWWRRPVPIHIPSGRSLQVSRWACVCVRALTPPGRSNRIGCAVRCCDAWMGAYGLFAGVFVEGEVGPGAVVGRTFKLPAGGCACPLIVDQS